MSQSDDIQQNARQQILLNAQPSVRHSIKSDDDEMMVFEADPEMPYQPMMQEQETQRANNFEVTQMA